MRHCVPQAGSPLAPVLNPREEIGSGVSMAQVFHRSTNTLSRLSIFGAVFLIAALAALAYLVNESAYFTEVNLAREQPVPFSHKHHVTEDGIDCRKIGGLVHQ